MTGPRIKGSAVLFSEMTPAPGDEARFNDWYDGHHTPNHVNGVPGFVSAHRYAAPDGPGYLAVYDLDGAETLESPEYRSRKYTPDDRTRAMLSSVSGFTRYVGREIDFAFGDGADAGALDSAWILAVFFAVPDDARPGFEEWYRTEHMGMLLACPDWRDGPGDGGRRARPRPVHPYDAALCPAPGHPEGARDRRGARYRVAQPACRRRLVEPALRGLPQARAALS